MIRGLAIAHPQNLSRLEAALQARQKVIPPMNKKYNLPYTTRVEGRCWPTVQQEWLIRAALLKGKDALDAWKEWKSSVDVEELDPGSHRMLPLLYRNLKSQGIKDPSMYKYKGVYDQTWYGNHILFFTVASLLRSFHDAGIETMIIKGAALTVFYYRDYSLRPMNDFDVLIHTEQVLPAIHLLQKLGWTPVDFSPTEEYISVSFSHGFRYGNGQEVDLHWHLLSQCRETDSDEDFWEEAVVAKFHDIPTHVLIPTDQLFHSCIHGAKWNYSPPRFRWVADAAIILNTAQSEIDWNRLIAQARKRRLVLPLRETLKYLHNVLDAPIPPEILQSIQDLPVATTEHIEYKVNVSPATRWTLVLDLWCQHLRLMGNTKLVCKLISFPRFLRCIWGQSLWKLPFYAIVKVMTWHKNQLEKRLEKKV